MKRFKTYLAAMALGLILAAGMSFDVQAASIDAGGTVVTDPEVPLADTALDAEDESTDLATVGDEEVPLSNMASGKSSSFAFPLLLLGGGAVIGAVGMKIIVVAGGKKNEKK